jgi:hypothetical protein
MSDMRELGERLLSNTCCRNFVFENPKKPSNGSKEVSMAEIEGFERRL